VVFLSILRGALLLSETCGPLNFYRATIVFPQPASLEGIRPERERTIAQGFGDSDYSTLFEVVNPIP
jgi:hypothetical protein